MAQSQASVLRSVFRSGLSAKLSCRRAVSVVLASMVLSLSGCGVAYHSPRVSEGESDAGPVSVRPITVETVQIANASPFAPRPLPAVFSAGPTSNTAARSAGALPDPVSGPMSSGSSTPTRFPPVATTQPYRIGPGDITRLSVEAGTPQLASVQDDGTVAYLGLGRIRIGELSVQDAETAIFNALTRAQLDPEFSFEVVEFNARRAVVGGAVRSPGDFAIGPDGLSLDTAIARAGGIVPTATGVTMVRLYRGGELYQFPLESRAERALVMLKDGDSVFVDPENDLDRAQAFFAEQVQLADLKQKSRQSALAALQAEFALQKSALEDRRATFLTRLDLNAVPRDYVFLAGEVGEQGRYPLPFDTRATLADALFDGAGGIPTRTGNVAAVYVLRGDGQSVTAWSLDLRNAAQLVLATRFELRPGDVVFVAEQPVTRWNRVVSQITPQIISTTASATGN